MIPQAMDELGSSSARTRPRYARDLDETVRLVTELGGKSLMAVQKLAGVGRFGLLESPQGVVFHRIEWGS